MTVGRAFVVVGPSGAGKDTLLTGACAMRPGLVLARRIITRAPEAGGEDHDSVTLAEFDRRRAAGDFAIDWQAHGLSYAIPAHLADAQRRGSDVIFNGSRAVLRQAAAVFPRLTVLHITAPAPVLAARLAGRGREDTAQIAARLARVTPLPPGLRVVEIVNDDTAPSGIARLVAAIDAADEGQGAMR